MKMTWVEDSGLVTPVTCRLMLSPDTSALETGNESIAPLSVVGLVPFPLEPETQPSLSPGFVRSDRHPDALLKLVPGDPAMVTLPPAAMPLVTLNVTV